MKKPDGCGREVEDKQVERANGDLSRRRYDILLQELCLRRTAER